MRTNKLAAGSRHELDGPAAAETHCSPTTEEQAEIATSLHLTTAGSTAGLLSVLVGASEQKILVKLTELDSFPPAAVLPLGCLRSENPTFRSLEVATKSPCELAANILLAAMVEHLTVCKLAQSNELLFAVRFIDHC